MEYKGKDFSFTAAGEPDRTACFSEMAIVDTFTKLIFGDEGNYEPQELQIIAGFRGVEPSVLLDSYVEVGAYLRNLGVREMIELVGDVKAFLLEAAPPVTAMEFAGAACNDAAPTRH